MRSRRVSHGSVRPLNCGVSRNWEYVVDPKTQQVLEAVGHFKDWSNYLLVTTVAALGWVAAKPDLITPRSMKITLICLCGSIVFAIFTLALIPIVAEQIASPPAASSFYAVKANFRWLWLWGPEMELPLKAVCWWQHVLFLAGVIAFTAGAYSHVGTAISKCVPGG